MTRTRVATVLGVVAVLTVVATGVVALATYPRGPDPEPRVVADPRTGAWFEVPAGDGWTLKDRRVRVYYVDRRGRPAAVVRGPAVFRDGYCAQRPEGSNRAFAGFTRQGLRAWLAAVAGSEGRPGGWSTGVDTERVVLADGSTAELSRSALFLGPRGRCSAAGVEVAMVRSAGVRVVLVRDTGESGTLDDEEVEQVLTSLRLGR